MQHVMSATGQGKTAAVVETLGTGKTGQGKTRKGTTSVVPLRTPKGAALAAEGDTGSLAEGARSEPVSTFTVSRFLI
jgi:hypothetical protein